MDVPKINLPVQTSCKGTFIKTGDTIPEIGFNFPDNDITGSTITLKLYLDDVLSLDLSTGSGITITDGQNAKVDEIPAAQNNLEAGVHIGDLDIVFGPNDPIFPDGFKKTLFNVYFTISKKF